VTFGIKNYKGRDSMADKNIQMTQRNAANTDWDNINPITKAANVKTTIGSDVEVGLADAQKSYKQRQAIINGNFDVWQRGVDFTTAGYHADRWSDLLTPSTRSYKIVAVAGQTVIPGNPKNYLHIDRVANLVSQNGILSQKIEDVATFSGGKATLSFWASGTVGKVLALQVCQNFGTGGSSQVVLPIIPFTLSSAWQKFSITFDVPSIAGKIVGEGSNLQLIFVEPTGYTFGTFVMEITSVQFNIGAFPLSFQPKSFADELRDCQRYYEISYDYGNSAGALVNVGEHAHSGTTEATSNIYTTVEFKVSKRVIPTFIPISSSSGALNYWSLYKSGWTGDAWANVRPGRNSALVWLSGTGAWLPVLICGQWVADAEL
jgi:hypothetical protein